MISESSIDLRQKYSFENAVGLMRRKGSFTFYSKQSSFYSF